MYKLLLAAGLLGAMAPGAANQDRTPQDTGYAVGYQLGLDTMAGLKADGVDFDPVQLVDGFSDAIMERSPNLDEAARRQLLASLEREVATRLAQQRVDNDPAFAALAEANLERSQRFHRSFGARDGVTTLDNGTQMRQLERGTGTTPKADDTIVISFQARLLDGTVFANEQDLELHIPIMMAGARPAMTRMKTGSTWEVAIPPQGAFGLGGQPPLVGPNQTIIATVELIEIK